MAKKDLDTLRHSTSHILAAAGKELFPKVKLGIGPSIADGFYYDFEKKEPFTPEDLKRIEKRMTEIVKKSLPFKKKMLSRSQAERLLKKNKERFKLELLKGLKGKEISFYTTGEFIDLCKGPHIKNTREVKAFKLTSIAGAYWRGKETNPMLQRIYGTVFFTKDELDEHLRNIEEAKKRDHRKLGKSLDLFSIHDEAGAGLVIYHPKGATLRMAIEDFIEEEHKQRGYQSVITPHIYKIDLWKRSGHYDFYRELMYFFKIEEQEYAVKPMNCPGHVLIYKSKTRSYKDLPIRYFELGTVYRHERSGVMHGLMRARGFTQDDGHIFCTPAQLKEEIENTISFALDILKTFNFGFKFILSTRPEDYIGSKKNWEHATKALREALKEGGLNYEIALGEGAFYGPKIDIQVSDALGRLWQCSTIQVDFNFPEKFDLTYTERDGKKRRCVMVHRALLGSIERFLGVLIEHYGGAFPVWLAPVQVKILPIADRHLKYASEIKKRLEKENLRVELDRRSEKIGKKIREAQIEKVPYMLIIGDKEVKSKSMALRLRSEEDLGEVKVDKFLRRIFLAIERKEC
ncbi:threonine--tRNA ligase [bacterium]|nr:threonine--tRNA ligase [bacterium]